MSALLLLAFVAGVEPDPELERARAAVAVEIAKAQLSAPLVPPTVDTSGVIVGRVTDPTGRHELVERWDGAQWVQEWRVKGGVSRQATPFGAGLTPHPTTTPTTSATTVERSSTTFRGSTGTAHIRTLAPGVATYGGTSNCPPSG
jgi:hypothetical protein